MRLSVTGIWLVPPVDFGYSSVRHSVTGIWLVPPVDFGYSPGHILLLYCNVFHSSSEIQATSNDDLLEGYHTMLQFHMT